MIVKMKNLTERLEDLQVAAKTKMENGKEEYKHQKTSPEVQKRMSDTSPRKRKRKKTGEKSST